MTMRYLSLCSGIEAATVAWRGLDFQPVAFAEIEPFPCAVLEHHYPNVPNLGDITKIDGEPYRGTVDLIAGGTPCQSFSVAGRREGLEDNRGQLTMHFVRLVHEIKPPWLLWENVPGVLSSSKGQDFACFLGAISDLGYSYAYRILDAQHFGVPQRRRRIFLVGHSGDWRRATEVLFEPESLRGDTAASQNKGQADTPPSKTCFRESSFGGYVEDDIAGTLKRSGGCLGGGSESFTLYEHHQQDSRIREVSLCPTINASWDNLSSLPIVYENHGQDSRISECSVAPTVTQKYGTGGGNVPLHVTASRMVRRLTPVECERLQGFPDNYTRIPYRGRSVENCPDSPRYRALGNSMAVPVMRWIGERILATQKGK